MRNISRRQFVSSAAAAGGVAAASTLLPQAAFADENSPVNSELSDEAKQMLDCADEGVGADRDVDIVDPRYDVDMIIAGSGNAGLSCAVEAADQGLKVLLCEAGSFYGGDTTVAEGCMVLNSDALSKRGITTDIDEAVDEEIDLNLNMANRNLVSAFFHAADDDYLWLKDTCGVQFEPEPNAVNELNPYQHFYVDKGAGLVNTMEALAESKGVTCLLGNRVKRVIMNDGRVAGAVIEDADGEYQVAAKTLVLATGGFSKNRKLSFLRLPWLDMNRVVDSTIAQANGDGCLIATAAGQNIHGMCNAGWFMPALKSFMFDTDLSVSGCNTPLLWVNDQAERFVNEDIIIRFSDVCYSILSQHRVLTILPQSAVDRIMSEGCPVGWAGYVLTGTKLTDLQNQLDQAIEDKPEGFYYGDSVSELAQAMGLDPDALQATVDRYNELVEKGSDDDFGKDPQYLWDGPKEGERVYGFELCTNLMNMTGGVSINTNCEVIDNDSKAIPGLYAAGADCSGLTGFTYPSTFGSAKQASCVFTGRTCARSAAQYIAG